MVMSLLGVGRALPCVAPRKPRVVGTREPDVQTRPTNNVLKDPLDHAPTVLHEN